jgi:hypothetical protein
MNVPRKLTANFVATRVDDEILIVDLDGGELLSLEGTGRAVWELIDGVRSEADIVAALAEEYDAPRARLAQDVRALVEQLAEAALVAAA